MSERGFADGVVLKKNKRMGAVHMKTFPELTRLQVERSDFEVNF